MLKKLTLILIVLAMIACTERPTASNFSEISDPNDKSDIGDTNGAITPDPDIPSVKPDEPSFDYGKYNDILIDRREMRGHNPVALAFGDKKNNLILVYIQNQKIYYQSSANMGLTLNPEVEIKGTQNAKAPHVFARGNKITIAYSANSTVYSVQGTFNPTDATIEFGQPTEINIKQHAQSQLGALVSPTMIATFTGAGKDGTHLVLPITVADLRDPVSVYCVAFAYSVDGKNWQLGSALRPDYNSWNNYEQNKQTSKYLQTKVFKVNGNNVEMLAQPRWNGNARGIGVFNANYAHIDWQGSRLFNVHGTVASDAQSSFETVIAGNGTYLIGAIDRDNQGPRNIVLRKYKGQSLTTLEKQVRVSELGTEASVAVFGDNTIAVFVNTEYTYDQATFNGKLVYKRFTPTYFDTHEAIGD